MSAEKTSSGMSRRHFMSHLAGASALAGPAWAFTNTLRANATTLKKNHKSCIMLWMGGGPPTIDMWDMKPGATTGGQFNPIATTGEAQINELMPKLAEQMKHLSVVRSMSTREADHTRGTYYMRTGYVPNPNIEHPSYGSVVAHEIGTKTKGLEIPPFVAIGGSGGGPGFLGMTYAPFQVNSNGRMRDMQMGVEDWQLADRMKLLSLLERRFVNQKRGPAPEEHAKVLESTLQLMTSEQLVAFKVDQEPQAMRDRYGNDSLARSCLLSRRLVEAGVPFVEVNFGGWDLHQNCFTSLEEKLPRLDHALATLTQDLSERGLLDDTVIVCMGEFGRTPRINENAGRDHWARSWSVLAGGGGLAGGRVIGSTNADGTQVTSEPYSSEDLMATVCQAMGISLQTVFTANNGRPMKIANSGKIISGLIA